MSSSSAGGKFNARSASRGAPLDFLAEQRLWFTDQVAQKMQMDAAIGVIVRD